MWLSIHIVTHSFLACLWAVWFKQLGQYWHFDKACVELSLTVSTLFSLRIHLEHEAGIVNSFLQHIQVWSNIVSWKLKCFYVVVEMTYHLWKSVQIHGNEPLCDQLWIHQWVVLHSNLHTFRSWCLPTSEVIHWPYCETRKCHRSLWNPTLRL